MENNKIFLKKGFIAMKDYKKPLFVMTDSVSEGVYMASGDSTCWTARARSVQDWNGSHNVFEITATHTPAVQHIYTAVTIEMTFNNVIKEAYSENNWNCIVAGNKVTVTRENHGNGYGSGDNAGGFKVWVKSIDEATTKGLKCTGCSPRCHSAVNVQGGF